MNSGCSFSRGVNAVERRVSRFPGARVFTGSLPEIFSSCGHVEQVVRDLKQESEMSGVLTYYFKRRLICPGNNCSTTRRRDD